MRPGWIFLALPNLGLDTLRFVPVVKGRDILSIYYIKNISASVRKKRPQAMYDAFRHSELSWHIAHTH